MRMPPEYVDFPNGERVEMRPVRLAEIAERLSRWRDPFLEEEPKRLRTKANRRQRRAAAAKARRRG